VRRAAVFLALYLASSGVADAAQRIVSLAPSVTETLFAVGAGGDLVGVTSFCDWPPEARKIDRVGSYLKPDVEAVIRRRPDLVIVVPSPGNHDGVLLLENLGLRIVTVSEGPKLDDVLTSIRSIAAAVGRREAGERIAAGTARSIAAWKERLEPLPRRRVLFIVDRRPLVAVGDGNLVDELLRIAGGENAAAGLGEWPRLSVEYLVRIDPEIIVEATMGGGEAPDRSFYDGLGLRAVGAGRLHAVNLDEVVRPGPRLAEGVEKLARIVHPEAFE